MGAWLVFLTWVAVVVDMYVFLVAGWLAGWPGGEEGRELATCERLMVWCSGGSPLWAGCGDESTSFALVLLLLLLVLLLVLSCRHTWMDGLAGCGCGCAEDGDGVENSIVRYGYAYSFMHIRTAYVLFTPILSLPPSLSLSPSLSSM